MQDLLSQLSAPIAIAIIIVGVVILVGVILLARRRRQQPPADNSTPMGLGGPIDYTSIPLDEGPQSFRDRFNNLSVAGKLLAVLAPVLLLLFLAVMVFTLLPGPSDQALVIPTVEPVSVSFNSDPALIRVEPSQVIGFRVETSGLPSGAELTVEMREDGQPFPWINPDLARATVLSSGAADVQVPRAEGAPQPTEGKTYTIVVSADGGVVQEAPVSVPEQFAGIFYGQVAEAPAATTAPTAAPTAAVTAEPTTEATAAPTVAALPSGVPAGVSNGGNVRALPFLAAENRVGGVNAGDQVQLVARTPNGAWYQIRFTNVDDGAERLGWISSSLLTIEPTTAGGVPLAPIVSVFQNGAVYEQPDLSSTQIDRVNAATDIPSSEVVELLRKNADGTWYEITNVRGISGWVPAELLGIPPEVAAEVPVAQ
jgi:flagellar FliL protein